MAATASENVKLGDEIRAQEGRHMDLHLSGEQEARRMESAQDLLKQLQIVFSEGEIPGTEVINDALLRTEQFLAKQAQSTRFDDETRKTLEDMAVLVGSAKQLARHKDLGNRLQRIADEIRLASKELQKSGIPKPNRKASKDTLKFLNLWRPVFLLLFSSREFRVFIVDIIKILRRILLRHHEGLGEFVQQRFVKGESPREIAKAIAEESKASFQTSEGDIRIAISDEEWDQLGDDVTRLLLTVCQQSQYRDGVEKLFNLLDLFRKQLTNKSSKKTKSSVKLHSRRAQLETEELIASFSGRETLDRFMASLKSLIRRIDKDQETREYLTEIRTYILETKNVDNMNDEEFRRRSRGHATRARELVQKYKYVDKLNEFLDAADELMENIRNDEFVRVLRKHAGFVASDLSYTDHQGHIQIDMKMVSKLRDIILPVLAETFKYIPVPRVEYTDEKNKYWVDNIVLCGYDILPDNIRFQIESDSEISIRDIETKTSHTRLIVTLEHIRTELKDLDFYVKRYIGPVGVSESGRVTIRIGGTGAMLTLILNLDQGLSDKHPFFGGGQAHFAIHKLDISFDRGSLKHPTMSPFLANAAKKKIQDRVEAEVEKTITKLLQRLGDQMTLGLSQINRPLDVVETVRSVIQSSEVGKVYERRRVKLE